MVMNILILMNFLISLSTIGEILLFPYRVRVRAVNDVGVGQYSPFFTISTQPLPPDPPLLDCIPSCSSLKLRWNSNDDEFKLQMMDRHGR